VKALSFSEYERYSTEDGLVPVYREIPADLLTPVSAFLALTGGVGGTTPGFLLESVVGGERIARYSFLGRDPMATLEARDGAVVLRDAEGQRSLSSDLFTELRARVGRTTAEVPGLPRFTGGAVGYLTYDAIRLFEKIPDRHPPGTLPLASFSFYRSLVAFDHVRQRLVLIANALGGRRQAFDDAQEILEGLEQSLRQPVALSNGDGKRSHRGHRGTNGENGPERNGTDTATETDNGAAFREAVRRAKEHIAAGDIFQVVLSRQLKVRCGVDPFTVYRALRMVNPSPYMYFLRDSARAVAGASPEMLVRVENGLAETRPLAGTRPRGVEEADDLRLEKELLADEKERAEHLMLVDLGRNDLGRVCRFQSVRVPEFMQVERYSHVMHIMSSVIGDLTSGKDALDALRATFPAGTLSGAPKIRAMEIIDDLEPARRGLYGGSLGYLDLRGNLDFCIAIRTLVIENGQATVQAGAGIVADSDPETELRETEAKAGAVMAALGLAETL
jgi:anthranilate synthase component I